MRFDATDLLKGMAEHEIKMLASLKVYGEAAAKKLEAEAKENAPWEDRTGLARETITSQAKLEGDKLVISLAGNMPYSVYLELAHSRRFAILQPTLDKNEKAIIEGLHKIIK